VIGDVIDSHTHLFLCEGAEEEIVATARDAGVGRMLNVGLGRDSNATAVAGAERHEEVFATAGCHPTSAGELDEELEAEIARLAGHEKVRAVGETGIDHYRETATPAEQRRALEAQVEIAREHGLPVVIHARDRDGETSATDEVFEILDARADGVPVILHCFLAPWRVQDAIDRGWFCSFSGIVTYPRSDALREAAAALPPELLLVETDAPYLAPQSVRGKPNEPAHVVATARAVAEVRGEAYEDLERVVEANARGLFGW
jgi:TatD DNase family protein